jgi:hypothetical protein
MRLQQMRREPVLAGLRRLALPALFLWGAGVCLAWGRIGFQPLDQSIVYDGGYRVATGQVPFRHFDLPAGLTPILLQAAVHFLAGPGWIWYCLHAAVFNGLFALVAHGLLRRLGAGRSIAGFYAALSALVFYVPLGVPYPDHHAFFFALVGLAAVAAGVEAGPARASRALGAGAAWALVAAALSKPIPSAFVLPLIGLPLLLGKGPGRRRVAAGLALGSLAALALLALAAVAAGIPFERIHRDLLVLPARTAAPRWRVLCRPEGLAARLGWAFGGWQLVTMYLGLGLPLLLAPWSWVRRLRRRHDDAARETFRRDSLALALGLGLLLACLLHALLTNRSPTSALAYLFIGVGLLHITGVRLAAGPPSVVAAPGRPWRRALARALALTLVAASLADAWRFHDRVNRRRESVLFGPLPRGATGTPIEAPADLSFLRWAVPGWYRYNAQDLAAVVDFLEQHPGAFFLLGDSSILYALTRRPSIHPALWFHPGLTYPDAADAQGFRAYQRRLLRRLKLFRVRYVVLEQSRPRHHRLRLSSFPLLAAHLASRECGRRRFGGFHVVELCEPSTAPAAPGRSDRPRAGRLGCGGRRRPAPRPAACPRPSGRAAPGSPRDARSRTAPRSPPAALR